MGVTKVMEGTLLAIEKKKLTLRCHNEHIIQYHNHNQYHSQTVLTFYTNIIIEMTHTRTKKHITQQ